MACTATPEDWLREASDPATPPARLHQLIDLEGAPPEVARRVAGNPNAPLAALLRLSHAFPMEVLYNPALPLYSLEDPSALFRPPVAIQNLLVCDPMPGWFFEALLAQWNPDEDSFFLRRVGEWLARHPSTPPGVLWTIATSINPQARCQAAIRAELPREKLELMVRGGSDPWMKERTRRREAMSEEDLTLLAAQGYWGAELAASHPDAPLSLLSKLAQDPRPTIVATVASNPRTPPALLESLASHASYIVRRKVAGNPVAGGEALARLAHSNEPDVIQMVILHKHATSDLLTSFATNRSFHGTLAAAKRAPPELLSSFVKAESIYVRRQAAKNPHTPVGALEQLAQDPRYEVRLAALLNPALPEGWLERLTQDRSKEVRARAERRLRRLTRKKSPESKPNR